MGAASGIPGSGKIALAYEIAQMFLPHDLP
jgi:hypothetical protein